MNLRIFGASQDRERRKITRTRTTRYVTLLSVVLTLALTAALAACGGDSPDADGERAASTPTREAAAATPTSGAVGPTSAETDREVLVALYNATDGPNWVDNDNWLSDAPLDEWFGVTTYHDGRV